jgi:selenocysteine-specific translation elongation factor
MFLKMNKRKVRIKGLSFGIMSSEEVKAIYRIYIQEEHVIQGIGRVFTGLVITGTVEIGQQVKIMPLGIGAMVRSIEMHHQPLKRAKGEF